eukprot:CAMPEP_0181513702 /NCGR_PEP_ID=MMETSP1110-20121109/62641_1 /TAXON_ID=174948 /ORGANISM="Symbiodinium sp., Strain CCMP421" /LENGTH=91 /DNA_ID=CAMNT_0023643589 /DNA_START=199 /DNA_END=474 /DNA_ORIENTATION=-
MPGFEVTVPGEARALEGGLKIHSGLVNVNIICQNLPRKLRDQRGCRKRCDGAVCILVYGEDAPQRRRTGLGDQAAVRVHARRPIDGPDQLF